MSYGIVRPITYNLYIPLYLLPFYAVYHPILGA